ncbi:MAG: hypothetical protein HYR74_12555 [Candidatus Eisenbacteria bacterium]|nr:hypothetical protein [Candidatus Eisenbacteria bacterium]
MSTPSNSNAITQHAPGCTLESYAEAKQLPVEFLRNLGLTDISYAGQPAVRIPYRDAAGRDIAVRLRIALEKSDGEDNRFRWRKGSKAHLYGLWRLERARAAGYLFIVEGESDAQTLWHHDLPAIGIPGASTWREEWAHLLDDIATIYVVIEPDAGGEATLAWLAKSAIRDRVKLVHLEAAKDPSALYLADPAGFRDAMKKTMDKAVPWTDRDRAEVEERRAEAWQKCQALAEAPDILAQMATDLEAMGVVGEAKAAKLIFLCVVSRLLEKPVSAVIKGPSSAGKSFLTGRVLSLFPEHAFCARSGMSERTLAYSDEPLAHRMLVIQEAAALQGEFGTYLLRSLLSEGYLRYETVEKTTEGWRPRVIERAGPTGLLITTTAVRLHAENETRLFSIPVTDTPEQTKQVMIATARAPGIGAIELERWHALQLWLEGGAHQVEIPFAETLAKLMPAEAVRLRRDFGSVLNLIRAHALLHQASREKDALGHVVAALTDYEAVRVLVGDLVAEGVEATVPARVTETVEAVAAFAPNEVTISSLARRLKLDRSTASRRAAECTSRGYLHNRETRRGQPSRLVVGDPMPSDTSILPTVEEIRLASDCTVASDSEGKEVPPPPRVGDDRNDDAQEVPMATDAGPPAVEQVLQSHGWDTETAVAEINGHGIPTAIHDATAVAAAAAGQLIVNGVAEVVCPTAPTTG